MPARDAIDLETRQRIAAYVRWAWKKHRAHLETMGEKATQRGFAEKIGIHEGTISNILSGATDAGFDVALALNRKLRMSADDILNVDPPREHYTFIAARRAAQPAEEHAEPKEVVRRSPRHAVARHGSGR